MGCDLFSEEEEEEEEERECTGEINGAVVVGVDFIDHVLQFRFGRVLAEGAHDGAEFFSGDLSCDDMYVSLWPKWGSVVELGRTSPPQTRGLK